MANSPLPLMGGVGGGLVRFSGRVAYPDMPSPNPSRKREGNL
jgi:hypothetical protein